MATFELHTTLGETLTKAQFEAVIANLIPSVDLVDGDTLIIVNNKLTVNDLSDKIEQVVQDIIDNDTLIFSPTETTGDTEDTEESENTEEPEKKLSVDTAALFEKIYPVGSIYENASDSTNPSELLGFGEWESFGEGRVLVGIDKNENPDEDFAKAGSTGGEKTHILTNPEMPSHTHTNIVKPATTNDFDNGGGGPSHIASGSSETGSTGSNQPHNNIQKSQVIYIWRRTS